MGKIKVGERFHLIVEPTEGCEWETYINGNPCKNKGIYAVIDTDDSHTEYTQGAHIAHLCSLHALVGLQESRVLG